MEQFNGTLHQDDIDPVLRDLELSIRSWDFWVSINRKDAIEALDIARANGEQTKKDTLLSAGFMEIIHNQEVRVAELLQFVQDEFMLPYDRLLKILKRDYFKSFWEGFEESLTNELRILDSDVVELTKIEVDIEWEDELAAMDITFDSYEGRSSRALMILTMLDFLTQEYPGKKLLAIQFS